MRDFIENDTDLEASAPAHTAPTEGSADNAPDSAHRGSEPVIPELQSEANEPDTPDAPRTVARSAELAYGSEYRRRLMKENARRLENERRLEDERERAERELERKRRADEILKAHVDEREQLAKRNEENDELINTVMRERESKLNSESAVSLGESLSDAQEKSALNEERLTVEIDAVSVVGSDSMLYIPGQTVYVPAPVAMPQNMGEPALNAEYADLRIREWNERYSNLCSALEEYERKLRSTDEAHRAAYNEQIERIRLAIEELERERQRYASEYAYIPDSQIPDSMTDGESDIAEYERYLRMGGEYDANPDTPETDVDTDSGKEFEVYASLSLLVKDVGVRLKKIDRQIQKIEKRETGAAAPMARLLYNNRLALEKEALDFLSSALKCAAGANNRGKIRHFRKLLISRITRYNLIISDFTLRTGIDVPLLSRTVPDDIIAGREYQKPVLLVCRDIDTEQLSAMPELSEKALRRAEREELRRAAIAAADVKKLERTLKKNGFGSNNLNLHEKEELEGMMQSITEQRSRDESMIEERFSYLILKAKTDRDLGRFSFGTRRKNNDDETKHAHSLVKTYKKQKKSALKRERQDNDRYYEILTIDTARAIYKKRYADRDKLESIRSRMKILLDKRDVINKRLYMIYLGNEDDGKKGLEQAYAKARRKAVKKAYRGQLRLYRRLEDERLPLDMKEAIYKLMNEKIALCGKAEELRVRIKNSKGYEKKTLKRERAKAIKEIRAHTSDIEYYFERKIKRRIEKNRTKKTQIAWLLLLIAVIGGGYLVYRFFGERILEFARSYIQGLFNRGGNA